MKKIIGIIGVIAITLVLTFSTNSGNSSDLSLASLIAINTASAEDDTASDCQRECTPNIMNFCKFNINPYVTITCWSMQKKL